MPSALLRLLIAGWVLVMLGRAAHVAWGERRLVRLIWRRIGWRHVLGAAGLLAVVLTVSVLLLQYVPPTRLGLGSLIDLRGNVVFAPLTEAATRAGAPAPGSPDWLLAGLATAFLGLLAALLPWLAFVEEEVFRAGLERASLLRELGVALVFGAAHLIMLVPLAAALAIAVAGFVYGRIYRRAHRAADGAGLPTAVAGAFRPTERSAAAADGARTHPAPPPPDPSGDGSAGARPDRPRPGLVVVDRTPERRQAAAVLESSVWHTAFNTLVVGIVWLTLVSGALLG